MEVEDLFEEAKKKREGMENPKMTARDHWNSFLISAIGPGSTLAAAVGYFLYYSSGMKKPIGRHITNVYKKWREGGSEAAKAYLNKNQDFGRNMRATMLTFVITTIVSMPLINWLRKPKRIKAENDAIKLTHIERVLKEKGYEISFEGRYVQSDKAQDHNKEPPPPTNAEPERDKDISATPGESNYRENITMERNRPKLRHVSLYMP
jgi:hypothetical protein